MAKGWTEFWLIGVAVDVVGVPLLISAGYDVSAVLCLFYEAFTIIGFMVWVRVQRGRQAVLGVRELARRYREWPRQRRGARLESYPGSTIDYAQSPRRRHQSVSA